MKQQKRMLISIGFAFVLLAASTAQSGTTGEATKSISKADMEKQCAEIMEKMAGMIEEMSKMMSQMSGMMEGGMMEGMMGGSGMGASDQKPSKEGVAVASLATQRNMGGDVTVEATLLDPKAIGEKLSFRVKLDTHTGSLDEYDLVKISSLRDDQGREFPAPTLEKPEGAGHHRSGMLTFSNQDQDGRPIVTHSTKYIELVIKDVAGVAERTFRWDL